MEDVLLLDYCFKILYSIVYVSCIFLSLRGSAQPDRGNLRDCFVLRYVSEFSQ